MYKVSTSPHNSMKRLRCSRCIFPRRSQGMRQMTVRLPKAMMQCKELPKQPTSLAGAAVSTFCRIQAATACEAPGREPSQAPRDFTFSFSCWKCPKIDPTCPYTGCAGCPTCPMIELHASCIALQNSTSVLHVSSEAALLA